MKPTNYVPLHVHTSIGSIRDSILRIEDYVAKGKALGMTALGISDHGVSSAIFKFYKECKKNNIKPIIGQEFYYSPDPDIKENYHLCVYAKNNIGLKNLMQLSTIAFTKNFYRKPRICREMLSEFSEGLIISQACSFSYPAQMIINNNFDEAISEIKWFKNLFKDDYYLEVHDHQLDLEGINDEVLVREFYREYGKKNNIKIVAGTDVHFLNKDDKYIHNIFKQLAYGSSGKGKDDGFAGNGYHVWTLNEMLEKFTPEEIENTNELATKCNINIDHNEYHLPIYQLDEGFQDSYSLLKEKCEQGLKRLNKNDVKEYIDRLNFELNIIHLGNVENYFLVVQDYINWAEENNILIGPARGSMAGSLICYCLNITKIDPILHKLTFSRAINKGRLLNYSFEY